MRTKVKLTLTPQEMSELIAQAASVRTDLCWPDEGTPTHTSTAADGTVTIEWED